MSSFSIYFGLGFEHILDVNGYDHILFVVALCAMYTLRDWKKVLILVTAFTIGHSITLALSVLNVVNVNSDLIEFLIPVTIFITAVSNLLAKPEQHLSRINYNYGLALFFGLIHGLGFSNYLKALLGTKRNIVAELLAFNLGLEIGQIIIVTAFIFVSFILVFWINVKPRDWKMVISSAIAGIAITLMIETVFW